MPDAAKSLAVKHVIVIGGGAWHAVAIETDGIALSPDAQWLYYRPLTDHNYWRVPTAALRDAKLSEAALSHKVQYLGRAAMSGGLIMDKAGTLFAGDIEHATLVALTIHGTHMTSRVFVHAPGQLDWADGFAISGGNLYISDSHLNELAFKNDLPRSGAFTIFSVKLPTNQPSELLPISRTPG